MLITLRLNALPVRSMNSHVSPDLWRVWEWVQNKTEGVKMEPEAGTGALQLLEKKFWAKKFSCVVAEM